LDEGGGQVAAFVRFRGGLVGEHTLVNVVNVLDDGIGGDDARVDGCGAGKRDCREEESGYVGELHVGLW